MGRTRTAHDSPCTPSTTSFATQLSPLIHGRSNVNYLDWIYIYAYAVAALLFLLFCWSTNAHTRAAAHGNEAHVLRRINQVDAVVQSVGVVGLLLVLASGLFFQP